MKITVVCVGKIKEKFFTDALKEYEKRLSRYCKLSIVELQDEKTPDGASAALEEQIKRKEGERILKVLPEGAYIVALAIQGKQLSSEELAETVERLGVNGTSHIVFIIGGSLGLSEEVLSKAEFLLSFSKMTFPHQLMRVVLLEQVYRVYRINSGEPYHK